MNHGVLPLSRRGLCPQTPGIYRMRAKMALDGGTGRPKPPRATSATESALGLRPRRALSSAQPNAEWTTANSPRNDFALNGTNPLNCVSHSRGSLQPAQDRALPLTSFSGASIHKTSQTAATLLWTSVATD